MVLKRSANYWVAICLENGMVGQGETQNQAIDKLKEAMVGVTEGLIIECEGRSTTDVALVVGDMILVGQVILEKLDLLADCKNQRLIPNPAHPERPVFRV